MSSKISKKRNTPRRLHNRFIRIIGQIHDLSYKQVYAIFKAYDQDWEATKRAVLRITAADAELSTINEVNFCF